MTIEENQTYRIKKILQEKDVQSRVQETIRQIQVGVKVTVGCASELFHLKASKLRELDAVLIPERGHSNDTGNGQRQYSLGDLHKLAIISELLNYGKIPVSGIPFNIDEIWAEVAPAPKALYGRDQSECKTNAHASIEQRVEEAKEETFWCYFTTHVLLLALNLICEDIPGVIAGIALPLTRKTNASLVLNAEEVAQLGDCLIGWRDKRGSFVTMYVPIPRFDAPSNFQIQGLKAWEEAEPQEKTFVIMEQTVGPLHLGKSVVETIRHLLAPIYEHAHTNTSYFEEGMKDMIYPAISYAKTITSDSMLTALAEMAVKLGGKSESGKDRWKFCVILVPDDLSLSLLHRSLVVQAQSLKSPHTIGKTKVSPDVPGRPILSLSLRAFQGIRVIYHPHISIRDEMITYRDIEGEIQSAIAIPIKGREDLPVGSLYLVSDEAEAFDIEDQRILRLMASMIGELLDGSCALQKSEERLSDVIALPQVVNQLLGTFLSEYDFLKDVGRILQDVKKNGSPMMEGVTSFIAVDVDHLSRLTNKYGDQLLIHLSNALGSRIEEQFAHFFDNQRGCKIYHIYACRFYLVLNDISLDMAREIAEHLRHTLAGIYALPIMSRIVSTSTVQPDCRVELEDIHVRLSVSSFKHTQFMREFSSYSADTAVYDILTGSILYFLDMGLNIARQNGGNCIASYFLPNPPFYEHSRYGIWEPPELTV